MKFENRVYTYGEVYRPAMEIQTQEEANEYFRALIEYDMSFLGKTKEDAIDMEKRNLGYYAGYYDVETMIRIQKFFDCSHPIFGSVVPAPEQAFEMGQNFAKGEQND